MVELSLIFESQLNRDSFAERVYWFGACNEAAVVVVSVDLSICRNLGVRVMIAITS